MWWLKQEVNKIPISHRNNAQSQGRHNQSTIGQAISIIKLLQFFVLQIFTVLIYYIKIINY